jgi:hypothetical protein
MKKLYKVIMHFNKQGSKSGKPCTIHYRGVCYLVNQIKCFVPMVSEFKPNKKSNPKAFFTAQAQTLINNKNGNAILY